MKQEFKNALAIIQQIKNDEWEFKGFLQWDYDKGSFKCYTATRNGIELWVANGWVHCQIRDKPWELSWFGVFVWWFAAKERVVALERLNKPSPTDLTL